MKFFTKAMLEESTNETRLFENASRPIISDRDTFDIFLSHSYADKKYIRKLKSYIETTFGLKCYVDWLSEPTNLDRNKVNKQTAEILRKRMRQSRSLIYCSSENSPSSKWMPWELGYFDAYRNLVAILPILDTSDSSFIGTEYLSLYPLIDKTDHYIWVNDPLMPKAIPKLGDWVKSKG